MQFVTVDKAHQHLNRDGQQETLCGYAFEDIYYLNKVYDHRDGFDDRPEAGPACAQCADAADAIQNGGR